jgi:hypothetical protein
MGTLQVGGTTLGVKNTVTNKVDLSNVGDVTLTSSANIKGAINASGSAPIYACRAWVNFDGTNAFSPNPSTSAIRASGNVSSITDGGTGVFRINFTTNLDSADYAISQGQQSYASCTRGLFFSSGSAVDDADIADPTVTGFWVKVEAGGSTRYDPTGACISVFL